MSASTTLLDWDMPGGRGKTTREVAIVFGAALILRILFFAFLLQAHSPEALFKLFPDSEHYNTVATYLLGWEKNGESALLLTGPGYGAFLAVFFLVFGYSALPILVVQLLLSGINCILVYWVARILMPERARIAPVAGIICAFSISAISLSGAILSETFFFTLFSSFILCFLKGLEQNRWRWFVLSGLLGAFAILTRGITQFLPLLLLVLVLALPARYFRFSKKQLGAKMLVSIGLMLGILCAWAFRNYVNDGLFTISEIGMYSARNYWVAAVVAQLDPNLDLEQVRAQWNEQEWEKYGADETFSERHSEYVAVLVSTLRTHPGEMLRMLMVIVVSNLLGGENLLALQRSRTALWWQNFNLYLQLGAALIAVFFWIGTVALYRSFEQFAAFLLVLIYLYFVLLSGASFWQGSRILFPTILAWSITLAFLLVQSRSWLIKVHRTQDSFAGR